MEKYKESLCYENEEKHKMEYDLSDRDDIANGFGMRHKNSFGGKKYFISGNVQYVEKPLTSVTMWAILIENQIECGNQTSNLLSVEYTVHQRDYTYVLLVWDPEKLKELSLDHLRGCDTAPFLLLKIPLYLQQNKL